MSALQKLLDISSNGIRPERPHARGFEHLLPQANMSEVCAPLVRLLSAKNGFLAFESALLVLPLESIDDVPGMLEWNRPHGWRRFYDQLPPGCVFFAQDLFASQFGITSSGIVRLDTETGEVSAYSGDLELWAEKILDNYDYETGWSVGRDWQEQHGPLSPGWRLLPRKPFVLGGNYVVENLVAVTASDAVMKLGFLYEQIKAVPDGQRITIRDWIT